jgi:large subunit ribosomal protein L25
MAEVKELVAQPRAETGSQAARRLRRTGHIPAVVYGHKEGTLHLSVPAAEVEWAVRHGVHVVDLKADGKTEKALIKDIQWDHLGKDLLHVDFARVSADERIVVTIPVELKGIAPGVTAGGLLSHQLHSLAVECLALQVPESIRVNINELQLGAAIHVRELVLPPDVKAMADPEAIVVHVTVPAAEPTAVVAPVEPGAAEPEVIGRQAKEEEEAE